MAPLLDSVFWHTLAGAHRYVPGRASQMLLERTTPAPATSYT